MQTAIKEKNLKERFIKTLDLKDEEVITPFDARLFVVVGAVLDKDENIVCFGACMPSLSKAIQKSKGHLTLPTLFRILKAVKKPEIVDLALIGVLPEYKMKGVSTILLAKIYDILKMPGVKYCETNLNLEDNYNIQNQWKNFDSVLHKRRRSFVKKIN